jgi:hypothetical protein
MVPERMRESVQQYVVDVEAKYKWNRPAVPVGPTVVATSYSEVKRLLAEPARFTSKVAQRLDILTGGVQLNITPVGST